MCHKRHLHIHIYTFIDLRPAEHYGSRHYLTLEVLDTLVRA